MCVCARARIKQGSDPGLWWQEAGECAIKGYVIRKDEGAARPPLSNLGAGAPFGEVYVEFHPS